MTGCVDFEELLSAHLDRELSEDEEKTVGKHLAQCGRCSRVLEYLKATRDLVRTLKRLDTPAALWPKLQSKIAETKVIPFPIRLARKVAAVAACAMTALGLITLLGYLAPEPTSAKESQVYLGSHAYHLMRQPLADHSSWSYVAGESNFELLADEE